MNEIRMLNCNNPDDVRQLHEILEDYKADEAKHINPVYVATHLHKFAEWIKDRFKKVHTNDFVIFGSWSNGLLIQIMVAYKFEIGWGQDMAFNTTPYWLVGLAYFRDKAWRDPGVELINLGLCLGAHFEKQGYYKFYTVKKMPTRIKTYTDLKAYIDSPAFKKTYKVVRYNVDVEKIFYTEDDLKKFRFATWSSLLPRGITRPVMLLQFTLDPTIDIYEIMNKV